MLVLERHHGAKDWTVGDPFAFPCRHFSVCDSREGQWVLLFPPRLGCLPTLLGELPEQIFRDAGSFRGKGRAAAGDPPLPARWNFFHEGTCSLEMA